MSINSLNKTYDPCQEPVCVTDPTVRVINYPLNVCIGSQVEISWTVDLFDDETLIIGDHRIKWSVNLQDFNREEPGGIAIIDGEEQGYYIGTIDTEGASSGILYFKIEVLINSKWVINEEGILFITLVDCDSLLTCPRVLEENPDGSWSKSLAYIEYVTWWVPDNIVVRSNLDENGGEAVECEGVILWESTCTATLNFPRCFNPVGVLIGQDEIKGLKDDFCYNPYPFSDTDKKSLGIYSDCFEVNDYDLPLSVEIIPNCCDTMGTEWAAYVEGVDFNVCASGKNDRFCDTVIHPISSTSSSSSSSRSSSSSGPPDGFQVRFNNFESCTECEIYQPAGGFSAIGQLDWAAIIGGDYIELTQTGGSQWMSAEFDIPGGPLSPINEYGGEACGGPAFPVGDVDKWRLVYENTVFGTPSVQATYLYIYIKSVPLGWTKNYMSPFIIQLGAVYFPPVTSTFNYVSGDNPCTYAFWGNYLAPVTPSSLDLSYI
jgi:hypothetical protein